MWALAIYNADKKILTLSRDKFGIKPLFYSKVGDKIVFSSEIKAMVPYLPKLSPNTSNYFLFYNLGYFPAELTSFKEIKKVLPGEVITFDITKNSFTQKFVDLPKEENIIEDENKTIELIQKGMEEAIQKHFVSDVPVGVLLSGGNDSSFIAAVSKKIGKNPTCFNVSIEGSLDNDYAEKVAKHLELPFERVVIKKEEFENQYKKVWDIIDQPTSDVSFIPTSLVYAVIKNKMKVVLSGEGGDELFGGYLRHKEFANLKEMHFKIFFPDLSWLSKISLSVLAPIVGRLRKITSSFESLGSLYLYSSRQIDIGIKQKETLDFLKTFYNNHPYKKTIQPNLFFDLFMYLPFSLMYKGDMSSMAYGIESRVPFLDNQLFKSLSKIHPKLRLSKDFTNKKIMKKAMERYLPKELIYRGKTGFGININKFSGVVLSDLIEAINFHNEKKEELGIVDAGLDNVIKKSNASIILKKYPRFAFALISNYKVMQKYCDK